MRRWLWVLVVALLLSTVASTVVSAGSLGSSVEAVSDLSDSGQPVAVSKSGGSNFVTSSGPSPIKPLPKDK